MFTNTENINRIVFFTVNLNFFFVDSTLKNLKTDGYIAFERITIICNYQP